MMGENYLDQKARERAQEPAKQNKETTDSKSAATSLVEIAEELYRFGVSTDGEAFAIPRSGAKVTATLRGSRNSLRGQIARTYFRRTGKAAPQQALADALLVIDGMAQEAEPEHLHLRVAEAHGAHYLDLGDTTGRAIKMTPDGWQVVNAPPIFFKRSALTSALPEPEPGGSLDELWQLLNVAEADYPLVAAWLVAVLHQGIAHPVLSLFGEQGTGKTTAGRHIVSTVDPSPVPTRKPPRDAESWVTAAAGSWVVGLDNLSSVPDWLSDSICRAVTGDGDVRRKLYTDGEHQVFAYRRCIIVNGIDLGGTRGDLAERMMPIHLEQISERHRRGDNEIGADWHAAHGRILGAVLDLAAGVAGRLPFVHLTSKPRMADFARILAAVDEVLGTDGLDHYVGKQRSLATDSLTADSFIQAMEANLTNGFTGTAAELLDCLTVDHPPKGWPTHPRQVTQRLRRQAPSMRKAGWTVTDDGGANHDKVAHWTIRPPEIARNTDPQDPQPAAECGVETRSTAGHENAQPAGARATTRVTTGSVGHAGHAGQEYRASQDGRCPACDGEGCGHCAGTNVRLSHSDKP